MDKKHYLTNWRLVSACVVLFGLFCVLATLVFHLDSLKIPIALYSYVSLGVCSYLMGHSLRSSSGYFIVSRGYGVFTVILAIPLLMLVSEPQFSTIGLLSIVVVILVFLVMGLQHKPLAQTPETSITTPSQT